MPLPPDTLCYFRHPQESWLWGKVAAYDEKKKLYSCEATAEGNPAADPSRVPPVPDKGPWAGGWPDPVPEGVLGGIPDNDANIFTVREDIVYSTEYEDTDDLLRLTILHDSTLLACIKKRYFKDVIYTFIGAIVVAVNPFNFKIPWYTDDNMEKYLQESYPIQKNLPHSWACAHNTYHELLMERRNQTILVSGESGAGKTEASKIVLRYLSRISSRMSGEVEKSAGQDMNHRIMACSPFLEAFGNAKTARNDNSSRFGKFMQIKFSENGGIIGANITKYLLEKSRIITAGPGERIYHSFYLAVRGNGTPDGPTTLSSDKGFTSLNSGGCTENNEFNTVADFEEVCQALRDVGIEDECIKGIWLALGAILHLVNATFEKDGDGCKLSAAKAKEVGLSAGCLGISTELLSQELVVTVIEVRGEKSHRKLNVAKATDGRDAFVKRLYDQVFSWLVTRCNDALDVEACDGWIGLLDIFGFEHFEVNSFEQLCINTANEALQGNYNEHIFRKDMDECRAEGVDVTQVEFPDNTPCIELVLKSKPPGIFGLLDSASSLSKGDPGEDEKWLADITNSFEKHKFFEKKRLARDSFVVKHFAGDVSYNVKGFVEKNADTLKEAWKDVVVSSSKPFIRALVWPTEKKLTVAGFFKRQLQDLMDIINSSNPHWIRCVKPHPAKKPMLFDGNQVAFQLTTSGVLATVSIRKAGFPVRLAFADFASRYRVLMYTTTPPSDPKTCCELLLESNAMDRSRAQLGSSRVFLKQDAYVRFEELKRQCTHKVAIMAQQLARVKISRLNHWRPALWLHSARLMQSESRNFLEKSREQRKERAARRRRAEEEGVELLFRYNITESRYRTVVDIEEQLGRFGCWVAKILEETGAAALGLNGDEERARHFVEHCESEARQVLRTKLTWAIDFKEVLEVELQEKAQRVRAIADIGVQWLGLLRIWTPMQLFELEMGRGAHSERTNRRRIVDEEQSHRRLIASQEVEGLAGSALRVLEALEAEEAAEIRLDQAASFSLIRREHLSSGSNALLSECVHLLRSDLSRKGAPDATLHGGLDATTGGVFSDRASTASTASAANTPLTTPAARGGPATPAAWWAGSTPSSPAAPANGAGGWTSFHAAQKAASLPSYDPWNPRSSSSQQSSPRLSAAGGFGGAAGGSLPISPISVGSAGGGGGGGGALRHAFPLPGGGGSGFAGLGPGVVQRAAESRSPFASASPAAGGFGGGAVPGGLPPLARSSSDAAPGAAGGGWMAHTGPASALGSPRTPAYGGVRGGGGGGGGSVGGGSPARAKPWWEG